MPKGGPKGDNAALPGYVKVCDNVSTGGCAGTRSSVHTARSTQQCHCTVFERTIARTYLIMPCPPGQPAHTFAGSDDSSGPDGRGGERVQFILRKEET